MVIGSKYPLGAPARSGGPAACLCHAVGSSSAGSLEAAPGPPADRGAGARDGEEAGFDREAEARRQAP